MAVSDVGISHSHFVSSALGGQGFGLPLYYWSADGKSGKAEVDFVYEHGGRVVPVEVKADDNFRGRSLASFAQEFGIDRSVRFSLRGYRDQGWLVNYPLYAADLLPLVP